MNVKNHKTIRQLSFKSLWASRKRNVIAIIAIGLTTLLFTTLFTIAISINASYQTYSFRQIGSYSHGSFKEVTDEQTEAIAAHPLVKETGRRKIVGTIYDGIFAKAPAEISFMDENHTKWSYAKPTAGHAPEKENEITMDTGALEILGINPKLGTEITLTYNIDKDDGTSFTKTSTFILAGYWEYDELCPVHYLNVSEAYADAVEREVLASGLEPFRTDLEVMMLSSFNIQGQMEKVDKDLGYNWETRDEENSVRIGVNWGYTTDQLQNNMDLGTVVTVCALLALIIFTGYLIIYNIFQISVSGDIRFYGLLKTIGVTSKQIRRIIRQQALLLCLIGIPAGLLSGYGTGVVLTPVVMQEFSFTAFVSTRSASPLIFIGSALFAIATVLLSCSRPGRIAAKVSPVEAVKYTEAQQTRKTHRHAHSTNIYQMAFANLGRNKSKTILVIASLALSVVLLDLLATFVGGFDLEKYVETLTCADFIVSGTDYFRFNPNMDEYIPDDAVAAIKANTSQTTEGCGYALDAPVPQAWMSAEAWKEKNLSLDAGTDVDIALSQMPQKGDLVAEDILLEGMDPALFDKLTLTDGDLSPLYEPGNHAIAIAVSEYDYENTQSTDLYPALGDTLTITYAEDAWFIDSRTGEKCDETTPEEYLEYYIAGSHDVEYTVCAYVVVPYSMGFRYAIPGAYEAVLPVDCLEKDSGRTAVPLFYLFDTPDSTAENAAEVYLADLTDREMPDLMYESKASIRAEFANFCNMFLLLGGLLCVIIGVVGILNFFNAVITGILSRKHEFAVLQSIGMTNGQLKSMLIYEGLFYALSAFCIALVLSALLNLLAGKALETIIWFFSARFTVVPVLAALPVFALLGWLIPSLLYGHAAKQSIVERLRDNIE